MIFDIIRPPFDGWPASRMEWSILRRHEGSISDKRPSPICGNGTVKPCLAEGRCAAGFLRRRSTCVLSRFLTSAVSSPQAGMQQKQSIDRGNVARRNRSGVGQRKVAAFGKETFDAA
jgi:hypothetical protein